MQAVTDLDAHIWDAISHGFCERGFMQQAEDRLLLLLCGFHENCRSFILQDLELMYVARYPNAMLSNGSRTACSTVICIRRGLGDYTVAGLHDLGRAPHCMCHFFKFGACVCNSAVL
jgi:hypothetical protein